MQFSIHVLPETFSGSKDGTVTGIISIQINGISFPEKQWSDFPVIITDWWLQEILDIASGIKEKGRCNFMDGPYWFEVAVQEDGWMVRFIEDRRERKCVFEGLCEPRSIVKAMLSAAEIILEACHKNHWSSRDLDHLASHFGTAQSQLRRWL